MESGTKLKLDGAELGMLVREAFGADPEETEELSDGWANTAYRVRLQDGRRMVLKLAPLPEVKQMRYEVKLMQTEVDMLKRLEGVLPVPRVFVYDNSRSLVASDYFFMEHLDGTPYNKLKPSLSPEEREAVELQLGRYNRTLNEVRGERFGLYAAPAAAEVGWFEVFRGLVEDVLEDGKEMSVDLPVPEQEVLALVEGSRCALDEVTEPRLVHWDLWDGNVFVRDGRIAGLIDFERAMWGDPLIEAYFRNGTLTEAFRQGYGLEAFSAAQEARVMLYDLYLDLIMHIERPFRQFASPDHEAWTRERLVKDWERICKALG
ncbi:phosphotransferase family protein [Paenibacillus sp. YN15]|uniref:phosphotransferase family protein n=1 Tax=Paenibacillus sp. YN15 TaxID=1742774 RepID=UPI000DCB4BD5|nr:aminoglycoside phosphotransferase family protein [Paenibacillus sp. YN15]RAU93199.1 aminoglycoside phosphotransferase family protein [Paenibacillus sp. YN15]